MRREDHGMEREDHGMIHADDRTKRSDYRLIISYHGLERGDDGTKRSVYRLFISYHGLERGDDGTKRADHGTADDDDGQKCAYHGLLAGRVAAPGGCHGPAERVGMIGNREPRSGKPVYGRRSEGLGGRGFADASPRFPGVPAPRHTGGAVKPCEEGLPLQAPQTSKNEKS